MSCNIWIAPVKSATLGVPRRSCALCSKHAPSSRSLPAVRRTRHRARTAAQAPPGYPQSCACATAQRPQSPPFLFETLHDQLVERDESYTIQSPAPQRVPWPPKFLVSPAAGLRSRPTTLRTSAPTHRRCRALRMGPSPLLQRCGHRRGARALTKIVDCCGARVNRGEYSHVQCHTVITVVCRKPRVHAASVECSATRYTHLLLLLRGEHWCREAPRHCNTRSHTLASCRAVRNFAFVLISFSMPPGASSMCVRPSTVLIPLQYCQA